jgi:microcompartment protein CcmK/EutM
MKPGRVMRGQHWVPDAARAGEGDLVIFEAGKEAAQANPNGWFNPADAAILGIVDALNTDSSGGT